MTDNIVSVFLEFKPVGNFHWIVNKASTFSFDQMVAGNDANKFKFIPVSACQDSWRANINSNHQLDYSKVTLCQYITDDSATDVNPSDVELIATEVGYGGVIVTLGQTTATIELGSTVQNLKGIFLIHSDTDVVLAYCILPEPVRINNYLQLSYTDPIIEITSTVNTEYNYNG